MSDTNPNTTYAVIKELTPEERLREQARHREEALINERLALTAERSIGKAEGKAETLDSMILAMRSAGMSEDDIQRIVRASAQYRNQQPQALDEDASDEEDEDMDFEP